MNAKFIIGIVAVVIAAVSCWNINRSQDKVVLFSELAMANVEALANNEGETGSGYCTMHIPCFNEHGNPTGKYTASSYPGPGCNGSYHSHGCQSCNKA